MIHNEEDIVRKNRKVTNDVRDTGRTYRVQGIFTSVDRRYFAGEFQRDICFLGIIIEKTIVLVSQ